MSVAPRRQADPPPECQVTFAVRAPCLVWVPLARQMSNHRRDHRCAFANQIAPPRAFGPGEPRAVRQDFLTTLAASARSVARCCNDTGRIPRPLRHQPEGASPISPRQVATCAQRALGPRRGNDRGRPSALRHSGQFLWAGNSSSEQSAASTANGRVTWRRTSQAGIAAPDEHLADHRYTDNELRCAVAERVPRRQACCSACGNVCVVGGRRCASGARRTPWCGSASLDLHRPGRSHQVAIGYPIGCNSRKPD